MVYQSPIFQSETYYGHLMTHGQPISEPSCCPLNFEEETFQFSRTYGATVYDFYQEAYNASWLVGSNSAVIGEALD